MYLLDVGFMFFINSFLFFACLFVYLLHYNKGEDYITSFLRLDHPIHNMGLYT